MSAFDYTALEPSPVPTRFFSFKHLKHLAGLCSLILLSGWLKGEVPSKLQHASFLFSGGTQGDPAKLSRYRSYVKAQNFSNQMPYASRIVNLTALFNCDRLSVMQMASTYPPLLDRDLEILERHYYEFQTLTGLNQSEICRVLNGLPRLIGWDINSMKSKLKQLAEMTGVSEKEAVKFIAKTPELLGLQSESMRIKIAEIADMTGTSGKKAANIASQFPSLLTYKTETLREKIEELAVIIGCTPDQAGRVVASYPRVLAHNISVMESKIQELAEITGSTEAEMKKLVVRCPSLMSNNAESMRVKIADIADMTSSSLQQAIKMVRQYPRLLTFSTVTMRDKISALKEVYNDSPHEIGEVLLKAPVLLSTPTQEIRNRFDRLVYLIGKHAHTDAADADKQARKMCRTYPPLLTYSFDSNLEPTLYYFLRNTSITFAEVTSTVCLLGYSLSKRIKPRNLFCMLHGRELTPQLVQTTDDKFIDLLHVDGLEANNFLQFKDSYLANEDEYDSLPTHEQLAALGKYGRVKQRRARSLLGEVPPARRREDSAAGRTGQKGSGQDQDHDSDSCAADTAG